MKAVLHSGGATAVKIHSPYRTVNAVPKIIIGHNTTHTDNNNSSARYQQLHSTHLLLIPFIHRCKFNQTQTRYLNFSLSSTSSIHQLAPFRTFTYGVSLALFTCGQPCD